MGELGSVALQPVPLCMLLCVMYISTICPSLLTFWWGNEPCIVCKTDYSFQANHGEERVFLLWHTVNLRANVLEWSDLSINICLFPLLYILYLQGKLLVLSHLPLLSLSLYFKSRLGGRGRHTPQSAIRKAIAILSLTYFFFVCHSLSNQKSGAVLVLIVAASQPSCLFQTALQYGYRIQMEWKVWWTVNKRGSCLQASPFCNLRTH